ncbi:hypothetical protein [Paenibacillus hexagrammi]|uniref:Secreted protein n=1 Tax=Paenibacillus hexagrammi TaxID=2908839 RepID=A0ABY3SRI9_9BACL|nr:hypothetical protein [Paenibacillus sp. YPD9-1]UJF35781.1 hypothetical protein L0M14_12250 [Paenibacillus sp. YPD9-1]
MLIFILGALHAAAAASTAANLARIVPGWSIVPIVDRPGERMNQALCGYDQPFFLTLQAGDWFHASFFPNCKLNCRSCPIISAD